MALSDANATRAPTKLKAIIFDREARDFREKFMRFNPGSGVRSDIPDALE
jgi:hypothetical protein